MTEEKTELTKIEIIGNSLIGDDAGLCFGKNVKGIASKIGHIHGKIKRIILEGNFSEIKVYEVNDGGHIVAKLNDDTGYIYVVMLINGSIPFREVVHRINEKEKYRIYGIVSDDGTFCGIDEKTIPEGFILLAFNVEVIS
jgi:hypothetical protein